MTLKNTFRCRGGIENKRNVIGDKAACRERHQGSQRVSANQVVLKLKAVLTVMRRLIHVGLLGPLPFSKRSTRVARDRVEHI
jgi:hypothetical protein